MFKPFNIIFIAVVLLSGCVTNSVQTPAPPSGKAMVLGIKPGSNVELIIRTVDGKIQGKLPFHPAYSVALKPGTYKIGPFCKVKTSYGQTMGPTDDITLTVEAGRTYKLEATPGGKQCIVRVATLP